MSDRSPARKHPAPGLTSTRRGCGVAVLVGLCLLTCAAPAAARRDPNLVGRLIERLADPSYHSREEAQSELVKIGMDAIPILRKAMEHPLPEVRHRARSALRSITTLTPKQRNVKFKSGMAAFWAGEYEKMRKIYAHLAISENAPRLDLIWLGHAHQMLEAWDEAAAAYERALEILDRTHLATIRRHIEAQQKRQAAVNAGAANAKALAERRRKVMAKQMATQRAHHVRRRADLCLFLGRIAGEVLEDLPTAVRHFTDATRGLLGATEPLEHLVDRWRHGDLQAAKPLGVPLDQPLAALKERARIHERLGDVETALEDWSRYFLVAHLNGSNSLLHPKPIARLNRLRDPGSKLPPTAGVAVMEPNGGRVKLSLDGKNIDGQTLRPYRVVKTKDTATHYFAMLPPPHLQFETLEVSCAPHRSDAEHEAAEGRVQCWGSVMQDPQEDIQLDEFDWPDEANQQQRAGIRRRMQVPGGIDLVRIEVTLTPPSDTASDLSVQATFAPYGPPAQHENLWANVLIETLPAEGKFFMDGKRVVHPGHQPLEPGRYAFAFGRSGVEQRRQVDMTIHKRGRHGLLLNLDSPFQLVQTDLNLSPGRTRPDADLVRLADGRWLAALTRGDGQLHLSTTRDLVSWDEPWPLPFNTLCHTMAPSFLLNDDGQIWLAFFSDRLYLGPTVPGRYRLWMTRSTDGHDWSRPRPVQAGNLNTPPTCPASIVSGRDGKVRLFWRDMAGAADTPDELRNLKSIGLKRKHKIAPHRQSVAIDEQGTYHMFLTDRAGRLRSCSSTDGIKWSAPVIIKGGDGVQFSQIMIVGGRAALIYETGQGMFLRRGTLRGGPNFGPPVKIAHELSVPSGGRIRTTADGQIVMLAGGHNAWLLRADLKNVLGEQP